MESRIFSLFETLIALALFLILLYVFNRKRKHPKYPPGPRGLPILGNLLQLGTRPYLAMRKWRNKYGDIFGLQLGLDNVIVINDPKLVKELFSDISSTGRSQNPMFTEFTGGSHGVINSEGSIWEEQRRFVLRTLRDMGFAKSSMEGMILEEVKTIQDWFSKTKGVPVSCDRVFNSAVVNSLWGIVSGERSEWEDENGNESEITKKSNEIIKALQRATETGLFYAGFFKYIIPEASGWNNFAKALKNFKIPVVDTIARHTNKLNDSSPSDLIDHYLIEISKAKEPNSSFFKDDGVKNLQAVIFDLFIAGNETTSATLLWTLLYLSSHPIAQEKLIDEIHRVVGKSRAPSLTDKPSLPYTEAVILEVLRVSALVPLGVPHKMIADKMFHGYFLPKNAIIFANTDAASNDPAYWGDPENFRPERFLSDDGTTVMRNHEALVPFSAGKRQCLGESLARDTLYLFTSGIFQKFRVYPDPDNPKADLEPTEGFINLPKPFRVVMKELL